MPQVVIFGAGNIGRGFLAQIFQESGFTITFVDADAPLVQALREARAYPLRLVDGDHVETLWIQGAEALHLSEKEDIVRRLVVADLAATAVGAHRLVGTVPFFAEGIRARLRERPHSYFNILLCENLPSAPTVFWQTLRAHLNDEEMAWAAIHVGAVETSIGRMIPVMTPEQRAVHPLLICAEPFCELPVDAAAFRGGMPTHIPHLRPYAPFEPVVAQKRFIHNMSHAAAAYWGWLRGHTLIWEAVGDPWIHSRLQRALGEISSALAQYYGLPLESLIQHGTDLLRRYANRALGDQIARVAREPTRKLAREERLIGAGLLCENQQLPCNTLALATAAAILYDNPKDADAVQLATLRREKGVEAVLVTICGLRPEETFYTRVVQACDRLAAEIRT